MKVKDIMTPNVKRCSPTTNLAAAAKIMWEEDCGAVPVTDDQGKVIGMITDRDICIAGATRSRTEGEIPVQDVISSSLFSCYPDDDVRVAMETMKTQRLRRLPVVGYDGRLAGIVSIHDVAVQARSRKGGDPSADEVLDTFIAITSPVVGRVAASA